MFGLARQSTVEEKQDEIDKLHEDLRQVRNERGHANESYEILLDCLDPLPNFSDTVFTVEQPRVAYKATSDAIVTLVIPAGAKVVYPTDAAQRREDFRYDKLRVEKARVVRMEVADARGDTDRDKALNQGYFEYEKGDTVEPQFPLNTDTKKVCAKGIHVFRTEEAAEAWWDACNGRLW